MMDIKISGIVVRGDGYGRKLGFPTVNLDTRGKPVEIKPGVYAGTAVLDGQNYRAGIIINPTGKTEAHLLRYSGDAYGKEVTLEPEKFLRDFRKFDTEKELVEQIRKDLELC